jgi:hypothetical protein
VNASCHPVPVLGGKITVKKFKTEKKTKFNEEK